MPTPNLNLSHITATQSNKETTANLAFDGLDNAMNSSTILTITGSRAVTSAQLRENRALILRGSPAATFTLSIPSGIARSFAVHNYTNRACFVEIASDRSGAISIAAGQSATLYSTGTEIFAEGADATIPYDIAAFVPGLPEDDELVFRFIAVRAFTIPAVFAGSRASAAVASSADTYFSIQRNGAVIGTIRFNNSATGTFSAAGAGPGSVAAGDIISIYAPPYNDATLSDISIVIAATAG